MEQHILPINQFKLDKMVEKSFTHIIGKRESGKSYMVKAIIERFNTIQKRVIISPSPIDSTSRFYANAFPNAKIHREYSSEIINALLKDQTNTLNRESVILVLDDCLGDINFNQEEMRELFLNHKIYNITLVMTSTTVLGIKPQYRGNMSYIMLFNINNITERKKFYDHYGGIILTFNAFNQVCDAATLDYNALVINNLGTKFIDTVFWCNSSDEVNEVLTLTLTPMVVD